MLEQQTGTTLDQCQRFQPCLEQNEERAYERNPLHTEERWEKKRQQLLSYLLTSYSLLTKRPP